MELPPEERADLAEEIMATLPHAEIHAEWTAEIERRAERARQDPQGGEPWERVEARLRARLPR